MNKKQMEDRAQLMALYGAPQAAVRLMSDWLEVDEKRQAKKAKKEKRHA